MLVVGVLLEEETEDLSGLFGVSLSVVVITSYSIHYTKLYDPVLEARVRAVRRSSPGRSSPSASEAVQTELPGVLRGDRNNFV